MGDHCKQLRPCGQDCRSRVVLGAVEERPCSSTEHQLGERHHRCDHRATQSPAAGEVCTLRCTSLKVRQLHLHFAEIDSLQGEKELHGIGGGVVEQLHQRAHVRDLFQHKGEDV